ncbi:prolyl-tRNA synthetase [Coniosporium apollinis CBS 100218]|uniref:proline--tRNA ligase n=1 Tax=Coniosporium apollinis (strain CBS 100218) TaxID=1168221 RepID=R7YI12_CONA1|nr:prolyl-tRNA synthetase [Coniosporium apollinis CBS 100218]EON61449.1 prolyl-tRNA synthetase [Coniosporium apollinis CBS 100218]
MGSIGASKVSLSSISSEELWQRSGRANNAELLRLNDRRESGFLLSPTHEEEITAVAAGAIKSYKELPLRLYQISRKYRDERRPRQGLLRAKEFLMKDLYTFDYTPEMALETYSDVRGAYAAFFNELRVPYMVAEADSGAMGGNLSHEYHFLSLKGEDNVCACNYCSYVANEELAEKRHKPAQAQQTNIPHTTWIGISKDNTTLIRVYYPQPQRSSADLEDPSAPGPSLNDLNIHVLKRIYPDLNTAIDDPATALRIWDSNVHAKTDPRQSVDIFDYRIAQNSLSVKEGPDIPDTDPSGLSTSSPHLDPAQHGVSAGHAAPTRQAFDLTKISTGDGCPRCSTGTLTVHKAIEVGHTFHLGTRYSQPLNAVVAVPPEVDAAGQVAMQMGCHGIGLSRMIGAVAAALADSKGLNWPKVIAPFEVAVLPGKGNEGDAVGVYEELRGRGLEASVEVGQEARLRHAAAVGKEEVVLDDRDRPLGWKMKDADLVGYPVIVVLGRRWKGESVVEVQCRRLGIKKDVKVEALNGVVGELLAQL